MGIFFSSTLSLDKNPEGQTQPSLGDHEKCQPSSRNLNITGLGTQWPELLVGPEVLEEYIRKWYDTGRPGLQKLIRVNQGTGIRTKAVSNVWDHPAWNRTTPPSIEDMDHFFRDKGVQLAASACQKALGEAKQPVERITHVVAVTATNSGAPGYDQLVANKLGIPQRAERVLLNGIGCAGGLAAIRVASNLASCATLRGRAANILVFACEICSAQVRSELEHGKHRDQPGIGPALFGDGAAALILSNTDTVESTSHGVYSLLDWSTSILPDTIEDMSYRTTSFGFLLHLSKAVPQRTAQGLKLVYDEMLKRSPTPEAKPADFDWAVHPGGLAVLKAAQNAMTLSDEQLRASFEIYESRGNSSSVAVLAVLDKLRTMGDGKDKVVACSFGPGLTVEAAMLKRNRS